MTLLSAVVLSSGSGLAAVGLTFSSEGLHSSVVLLLFESGCLVVKLPGVKLGGATRFG